MDIDHMNLYGTDLVEAKMNDVSLGSAPREKSGDNTGRTNPSP